MYFLFCLHVYFVFVYFVSPDATNKIYCTILGGVTLTSSPIVPPNCGKLPANREPDWVQTQNSMDQFCNKKSKTMYSTSISQATATRDCSVCHIKSKDMKKTYYSKPQDQHLNFNPEGYTIVRVWIWNFCFSSHLCQMWLICD